jgi:hypothetical protein
MLQEPRELVRNLEHVLRFWYCPAFGIQTSWTICVEANSPSRWQSKSSMHAREVTWDRQCDMGRFADPLQAIREGFHATPTIYVRDAAISASQVTDWLQEVSQIGVPVLGIEGPWGLDGAISGIETFDPFLRIHLEWWGDGPEAWRALMQAVGRMHKQVLDCLDGAEN